ncbi:hypothetical protein B0T14DRAFT_511296, partial [Immersiella caudata]
MGDRTDCTPFISHNSPPAATVEGPVQRVTSPGVFLAGRGLMMRPYSRKKRRLIIIARQRQKPKLNFIASRWNAGFFCSREVGRFGLTQNEGVRIRRKATNPSSLWACDNCDAPRDVKLRITQCDHQLRTRTKVRKAASTGACPSCATSELDAQLQLARIALGSNRWSGEAVPFPRIRPRRRAYRLSTNKFLCNQSLQRRTCGVKSSKVQNKHLSLSSPIACHRPIMGKKERAEAAPEASVEDAPLEETPATMSPSKKRKSSALKEIEVDLKLPEPPSKKARRALKKGKTLPAKPSSDDEEDEDGDGKKTEEGKKKKERSPYGVWIGNLRFNATKTELRKWLVDNSGGAITDELITRVHMPNTRPAEGAPKPKTSENRGFAYVDFATFEANVAAIALSETELAGRKLLIKDAKSFDGRPKKEVAEEGTAAEGGAAATEVKKKNPSTKIFVGNLAFQVTEDDLRAHFEKCGPIRWIKVATFEDTGKCKGYGWVNFEEAEAAEWAVKGFVKIKETIDTLEDFMDEDTTAAAAVAEDEDAAANGDNPKKTPKKATEPEVKVKTRKWWVNKLQGRPLKIELAEDDQTRYKKRFRGGGQRKEQNGDSAPAAEGDAPREKKYFKEKEKKAVNYANDISVARLTGAVVAPQGKKTTF